MKKYLSLIMITLFAAPATLHAGGRSDYDANCAGCHGANGNVQTEKARVLKMDVKKLSLKASRKNRAEMAAIISNGKGSMPSFGKRLSKDEIDGIIDYVVSLRE